MDNTTAAGRMGSWFENEEFWLDELDVLFNRNMLRFSFLEAAKIEKLSNVQKGSRVLDLCCGVGRHSVELARLGYHVTGADITQSYLDLAKKRSLKAGLNIEYVRADARDFCRPMSYELIINMFNSFGYFPDPEDDVTVLQNCYDSLVAGGMLFMEMLSKEVVSRDFRPAYSFTQDNYTVHVQQRVTDDWSWLTCNWLIKKEGSEKEIVFSHRLYAASEMKRLLSACGFTGIKAFGSLGGQPFDHTARNLVLLAKKPIN